MLPPRLQHYSGLIDLLVGQLVCEAEKGAETMKASPGKDWPSDRPTAEQDQQRANYTPIPDHAHSRA